MKFKFNHTPSSLLEEMQNNETLFWDGCNIPLNDIAILIGYTKFEDKEAKKVSIEEMLMNIKENKTDYSTYESKIYFRIFTGGKYETVCEMWKTEFEACSHTDFERVFEIANTMLEKHFNVLSSLVEK